MPKKIAAGSTSGTVSTSWTSPGRRRTAREREQRDEAGRQLSDEIDARSPAGDAGLRRREGFDGRAREAGACEDSASDREARQEAQHHPEGVDGAAEDHGERARPRDLETIAQRPEAAAPRGERGCRGSSGARATAGGGVREPPRPPPVPRTAREAQRETAHGEIRGRGQALRRRPRSGSRSRSRAPRRPRPRACWPREATHAPRHLGGRGHGVARQQRASRPSASSARTRRRPRARTAARRRETASPRAPARGRGRRRRGSESNGTATARIPIPISSLP